MFDHGACSTACRYGLDFAGAGRWSAVLLLFWLLLHWIKGGLHFCCCVVEVELASLLLHGACADVSAAIAIAVYANAQWVLRPLCRPLSICSTLWVVESS